MRNLPCFTVSDIFKNNNRLHNMKLSLNTLALVAIIRTEGAGGG
jgi:ABC-type phosphate/phosphonate transport system ATPase subunit